MKILALELSTARGSLAWLEEGDAPVLRGWPNDRKHSGKFFDNLAEVQKQFGPPDKIIVGLGPGSYAGTRIAISTAIGLEVACKAQLAGYPSICAMDLDDSEFCVIGDARRQSFYFGHVRAHNLIEGPVLCGEAELTKKLKQLDGVPVLTSEELPQFENTRIQFPSAAVLARLARDPNRSLVRPPLEPIYLREPHITVPKSFARTT